MTYTLARRELSRRKRSPRRGPRSPFGIAFGVVMGAGLASLIVMLLAVLFFGIAPLVFIWSLAWSLVT